jgi:O-antigen biosynthesis protein WbqV
MSDQHRTIGDRPNPDRVFGERAATRGFLARRSKLLLIGSWDAVRSAVRQLRVDPRAPAVLAGALIIGPRDGRTDVPAPDKVGRIPVLGDLDSLEDVAAAHVGRPLDGVVICGLLEQRSDRRLLLDRAARLGLDLWQAEQRGNFVELRAYDVADLIGPGALSAQLDRLHQLINGRRVLVTGAGGSIGSQLCRRIATLSPARLTLMDSSEYNLFTIHHRIEADHPRLPLTHALCDIREQGTVERWFQAEQPQIVFHAAALKQLPMVEAHPSEGVLTNVLGTRVIVQASLKVGAQMLLVSTDKAVDPSAVMGASKRLAELYCQAVDVEQAKIRGPRVMAARLGNVLGSAGSVVQIFERQIADGGPVTVTDPDATRYFITIPQAADFLLLAASDCQDPKAARGSVHVMEMGDPVRIVDLARDLIRLAGRRPDTDVKVSFVGLRAGEKVSERLIAADEWVAERRSKDGVYMVKAPPRALRVLEAAIDNLVEAARSRKDDQVRTVLHALVAPPETAAGDAALAG